MSSTDDWCGLDLYIVEVYDGWRIEMEGIQKKNFTFKIGRPITVSV